MTYAANYYQHPIQSYTLFHNMVHTFVPSFKSFRSKVSPAGTSMLFNTMMLQDDLLALALAAELKVQEVDLFICETRDGAGAADATAAPKASMDMKEVRILYRYVRSTDR